VSLHPDIEAVLSGKARWAVICADNASVLPEMPDKSVAHVITDPPYEAEAHTKARRSLRGGGSSRKYRSEVRAIDAPLEISFEAITEEDRLRVAREFGRLASRWTLNFCQVEAVAVWRFALHCGGLDWVRGGAWVKPNGAPQFTGDRPAQGFECIAIAHQPGRKRWNGGGSHGVWIHPIEVAGVAGGGSAGRDHPTQKPVPLMLDLVSDFTDPDELILDPFAGSGTTGVAALRLGRRFIGIEKDEKYAAIARERLAAEERGLSLRDARAGQVSIFDVLKAAHE
jgi:hypothetical protein